MEKRLKIEEIFTHPWVLGFEKEQIQKNKKEEERRFSDVNMPWNTAVAGFYKKRDIDTDLDVRPENVYLKRKGTNHSKTIKTNSSKVIDLNLDLKSSSRKDLKKVSSPMKEPIYNYRKKDDKIVARFLGTSTIYINLF